MRTYAILILCLMILVLLGCSKSDPLNDPEEIRSQFVLEFEDKTISAMEEDPTPFARIDTAVKAGQVGISLYLDVEAPRTIEIMLDSIEDHIFVVPGEKCKLRFLC